MKTKLLTILAVGLLAGPISVQAVPISYTFTGIASGTLNQTSFTDVSLTVTVQGDTSGVISPIAGVLVNGLILTNTISLGALLSASITEPGLYVFNNQTLGTVGFGSGTVTGLIDLVALGPDGALATYDLASTFGPLSLPTSFFSTSPIALSGGGTLSLTSLHTGTFAASTAAVPEPGTLALFGLGLAGFAMLAFARRRKLN